MIAVLVHWRIRPNEANVEAFLDHWKSRNIVKNRAGLIGEFLCDSVPATIFPETTWQLDTQALGNFRSYVTIGLWSDPESFRNEVAAYFNDQKPMLHFEKYRRRRVLLDAVAWRTGQAALPSGDSPEVD